MLALRSARFIRVWMILFRRAISACKACSFAPETGFPCSDIAHLLNCFRGSTDSDSGECLVDVYTVELFAIAAKTDGIVTLENLFDAIIQSVLDYFQIPQNAIAAEDE